MITAQEHNQRLIDFIKVHQPISMADLFGTFEGAGNESTAFSKRLAYLKSEGWLLVEGRAAAGMWSVNPEQRPMHSAATVCKPTPKLPQPPAPAASAVVPPPRINIMRGHYSTPPAATCRPGSDDHTRCPSLRQGQRVAFVAGYISL